MVDIPIELGRAGHGATTPVLPVDRPPTAPPSFHVLAKPTGPICNLDCTYCFFLEKEALYPGARFRMTDAVTRTYIRQVIESQLAPEITIAWQGGEPTLMGLDFFRRAVAYAEEYAGPGRTLHHTIQTNGTLLTEAWCEFLREKRFLVGISIDGPEHLHDVYRVDKQGRATFGRVRAGLDLLTSAGVEWNVLCTVHAANQAYPLEVYRYFRDDLGATFVQFIPIVERVDEGGDLLTDRSVDSEAWGRFLTAIFDEWLRHDVGDVFVQMFDAALASWYGAAPALCIFSETCGNAVALEHNGDLYSCDHFVDPQHLLGNITETHMVELMASAAQRDFGSAKRESLPRQCRECPVLFACRGECPKNRVARTPDGEAGLNHLCAGYLDFFTHIDGVMRLMTEALRRGGHAGEVMRLFAAAGRNDECPCGSGRKTKHCHG
ncbi:MAG: anaerobic sulfatase maturase [Acidimicrobiia bacterium]